MQNEVLLQALHESDQKGIFGVKNHKKSKGLQNSCKVVNSRLNRISFLDCHHLAVDLIILKSQNRDTSPKRREVLQHSKTEHRHISAWRPVISHS